MELLEVLHDEAKLVDFTCKAISSSHVAMTRRKKTKETQAKVQKIWDEYEDGQMTACDLLQAVAEFVSF